jgi:hypothetical protein
MSKLIDFLPNFEEAFEVQIGNDEERWGDTWKHRGRDGQEERAFERYRDYLDQFRNAGVPIPWLKVAGEAMICWVRENIAEEIWRK